MLGARTSSLIALRSKMTLLLFAMKATQCRLGAKLRTPSPATEVPEQIARFRRAYRAMLIGDGEAASYITNS